MDSIAITGEEMFESSFDDFQRQTSLMTSCTPFCKELSDHFTSLELDLQMKSEALKEKFETSDHKTKETLNILEKREVTIVDNMEEALMNVKERKEATLIMLGKGKNSESDEISDDVLGKLKVLSTGMDAGGLWKFVI